MLCAHSLWPQPCQRGNLLRGCPTSLQLPGHSCMSYLWRRTYWLTRNNKKNKMFLNRKWMRLFFHTNKSRLALVLNEEQLAPVCADRLHTEHHHVGPRQQPQGGWQQELGQGALIAGGSWTGNSIICQSCIFVCISNFTQKTWPRLLLVRWLHATSHPGTYYFLSLPVWARHGSDIWHVRGTLGTESTDL